MQPFDHGPRHERRDLIGYGNSPPSFVWPNGARVAISFVLNYEEGGENTHLNNDLFAENFLTENGVAPGVVPPLDDRELSRESTYNYGSRVGFWRILNLFKSKGLRFTSWAVGKAVELNPAAVVAMEEAGCEVASHAYRWINYGGMAEEVEREHVAKAVTAITKASPSSKPPLGWYTGRCSINTRRLVYEYYKSRGLEKHYYESDAYDDDLPYYVAAPTGNKTDEPLLIVPYIMDSNDMKFAIAPGFSSSLEFGTYITDALQTLLDEAYPEAGVGMDPKSSMITIGLHCRIVGRPGRFQALKRFVELADGLEKQGKVWITTRGEIAQFWRKEFPPQSASSA